MRLHAFPAYISRLPFPFGLRGNHFGLRGNHPGLRRYRPILRPIFLVVRFHRFIHSFNIIQFITIEVRRDVWISHQRYRHGLMGGRCYFARVKSGEGNCRPESDLLITALLLTRSPTRSPTHSLYSFIDQSTHEFVRQKINVTRQTGAVNKKTLLLWVDA